MRIPTNRVTFAGLLIALGIIYGDIGTSPLYVLNEIVNGIVDPGRAVLYYLDANPSNNHKVCDTNLAGG